MGLKRWDECKPELYEPVLAYWGEHTQMAFIYRNDDGHLYNWTDGNEFCDADPVYWCRVDPPPGELGFDRS